MIKINPAIRGAKRLEKSLKAESRRQKKALSTAIKVEGFRLRKVLKQEIRQQAPGGRQFEPMSMISRKRRRRKKPLAPLAKAVRYYIPRQDPVEMHIGWVGPKVSKSWKRIAEKQQEGFDIDVSRKQRRFLAEYGGEMDRSKYKPFFFIKSGTQEFDVPARPIMRPFWNAHETEAKRNIAYNYRKKLKGERI
ncbi:MAG: hypothetical protein K9J79_03845 [Desulfobacteraceae bacterium]|nr:hypothetical protein [Desulfobacteraceae bacterium]